MKQQGLAMRILVVDDNNDILQLVQSVLQVEGYDVVIARDGLEAMQRHAVVQPDAIVCDVNLPGINGWEVCRRIKAQRNVPVMLLTVRNERADIERSMEAGADDHMPKPFDLMDFTVRVRTMLAHTTNNP